MARKSSESQSLDGRNTCHKIVERLVLPPGLRFSREHAWGLATGDKGDLLMVGVTEVISRYFLQISNIEFVQSFAEIGTGDVAVTIRGTSQFDQCDLSYSVRSPFSGMILCINPTLRRGWFRRAKPHLVLTDPYQEGWLYGVAGERAQIGELMSAGEYRLWLHELAERDPTFLYHHVE